MTRGGLGRSVWVASVAVAAGATSVSAQRVTYEGGVTMTRGAYIFSDPATVWSLSTGLALASGPWTVRVGIPVSLQNSALVATGGVGPVPTGGSSSGVVADSGRARHGRGGSGMDGEGSGSGSGDPAPGDGAGSGKGRGAGGGSGGSGMSLAGAPVDVPMSAYRDYFVTVGDPLAQVGWRASSGRATFSLTGMVKAPLADTTGIGTGQWDAGVGAGISHRLGVWGGLGLDASYWRLGDLPDLELRDPLVGSVSLIAFLGRSWAGGLSAQAATAILEGYDPSVSIGFSLARIVPGRLVSVQANVGLTETAPGFSLGMGWVLPLAGGY